MTTLVYDLIDSPVGPLLAVHDDEGLRELRFERTGPHVPDDSWRREPDRLDRVRTQLDEYFAGRRTTFDVPLSLHGTDFQRRVWHQLTLIPYGSTATYGELAARLGNRNASRAVGLANARNPVPIVVPCHRVIGADGTLTGFAGGIDRKRLLLNVEAGEQALFA